MSRRRNGEKEPMDSNFRFLLVDDSPLAIKVMRVCLNSLGYDAISEANDGKHALDLMYAAKAERNQYGMIFLDWSMPGMNGLDVLNQCKATPDFAEIAVVVFSANRDEVTVMRAMKAGATDYITKPIAPEELTQRVAEILNNLKLKKAQ
jgi:CheY-like chemotaxis protein